MTLEDQVKRFSGDNGRFPVGLRVLAVDDDASCLKLVENLLRKCQYDVTTTNQPMEALKMLRRNKHKFDIVITDVNMPGMDGYKLLELIGIEMDLPVIMLSAHSDTEFVMKGINHGACDYLVKPCRMAEIKNIWQHVVRRKHKVQKGKNDDSNPDERALVSAENCDHSKVGRKRKEQIEEGEDDLDENEDPSTQKKPRVVWSVELHRKFVAAVTQLTLKRAVPKKILDLMNVEGLTRENVASHLQKYRLYLKRFGTAGIQQENPMQMSSIEGFGLSRSRIFSSNPLPSYPPLEVPSRNLNDSFNSVGNFPPNQSADLFNEIPMISLYGEFNPISTGTSLSYFPANRMILDGKNHGAITPMISESIEIDGNVALDLLRHDQSSGNWQRGVHLSKSVPSNSSRLSCGHSPIGFPSTNSIPNPLQTDSRGDEQCREDLIGIVTPTMDFIQKPEWEEHQLFVDHNSSRSVIGSSVSVDDFMDPLNRRTVKAEKLDVSSLSGRWNGNFTSFGENQNNVVENLIGETKMNFNANNIFNTAQHGFIPSDFDSVGDIVNGASEQDANEPTTIIERGFWI